MGRGIAFAPPPVEAIKQAFALRQDGVLTRRQCHIDALNGEPATFIGPAGRSMARLTHDGKVRRILASRLAWALQHGSWPLGIVKTLGEPSDLRAINLSVVPHGAHQPQADAGRASSLARRQGVTIALLNAMAERANPSLKELSAAIGLSEGRVSTRLNKLADAGLTTSPMCVPGRSWHLTQQGRELVQASIPMVIDDLDRAVLMVVARSPSRLVAVAQQVDVCHFTARRRLNRLAEHGMVEIGESRRFQISAKGRALLGDAVAERWVRPEAVAASLARDVVRRLEHPTEMPPAERSRLSSEIATRARKARGSKWVYHSALAG